jgi:hypothetical protein
MLWRDDLLISKARRLTLLISTAGSDYSMKLLAKLQRNAMSRNSGGLFFRRIRVRLKAEW